MTTRFHQATEALLAADGRPLGGVRVPVPDVGWAVPAAVAEWYSLPDAVGLLRALSNCDHPLPLARCREVADDDHEEGAPLRVFMHENQHVCEWAVLLDGSDDPPVRVNVDDRGWVACAGHFSTFVHAAAFDYPTGWLEVWSQTAPLPDRVRRHLDAMFQPGPTTYGWPGATNRRYFGPGVRLTIWETDHPDWWFRGRADADLDRLLADVSGNRVADLTTAHGNNATADGVVNRWRQRVSRDGTPLDGDCP